MKNARWLAGVLVVVALCTRPLSAQIVESVPAKALVVVKVHNLQATSSKIAKLANDLGVAAMVPEMNDPLKSLEDRLKITQGINAGGDLLLTYLDPAATGEASDKSVVILVPVTDYKTFLGNFAGAETDGDVSQVKMGDDPEPSYLASWGGYAALSPSKACVATKPTESLKVTAAGEKELTTKDLVVYANFAALRTVLRPKLAEHRAQFLDQLQKGAARTPQGQSMAPMIHMFGEQALNAADAFLRDTQAATWSLNLGEEGLSYSLMAEFDPASYIGTTVLGLKTTSDPLLGGLPSGKYLAFGGFVVDPASSTKLMNDIVAPIMKDVAASDPEKAEANSKLLTDYTVQIQAFLGNLKGGSIGLYAPTGALGQESLIQQAVVFNGNADAMLAAQQKAYAVLPDMMKAMGMPADTYKISYTPKAKTVDGVTFDSAVTNFTPDPNSPQAQQTAQMMTLMYGPAGLTQLFGASGEHLLVGSGLSDAQLSTLIDVAKTNDAPLSTLAPVKKLASQLPPKRIAEFYVPLDTLVTTGLTYAKQFGFAVPVQLPPDLPPIGSALSTDAASIRLDTYVPTALIQSLVAAGMQAAMQMNGGGGM